MPDIISVDCSVLNCRVLVCEKYGLLTPRSTPTDVAVDGISARHRARNTDRFEYCDGPFRPAVHIFAVRMAQADHRRFNAE